MKKKEFTNKIKEMTEMISKVIFSHLDVTQNKNKRSSKNSWSNIKIKEFSIEIKTHCFSMQN